MNIEGSVALVGVHTGFVDTDLVAALDVPKTSPVVVATAALDALEANAPEGLVDEATQKAKAALSRDQQLIYPDVIAGMAAAR